MILAGNEYMHKSLDDCVGGKRSKYMDDFPYYCGKT